MNLNVCIFGRSFDDEILIHILALNLNFSDYFFYHVELVFVLKRFLMYLRLFFFLSVCDFKFCYKWLLVVCFLCRVLLNVIMNSKCHESLLMLNLIIVSCHRITQLIYELTYEQMGKFHIHFVWHERILSGVFVPNTKY